MISKCLLLKPKRAGRKTKRNTKKWTLDRFEKWKSGEIMDLWNETVKYQNISNMDMNHHLRLSNKEGAFLWQEKEMLQKLYNP